MTARHLTIGSGWLAEIGGKIVRMPVDLHYAVLQNASVYSPTKKSAPFPVFLRHLSTVGPIFDSRTSLHFVYIQRPHCICSFSLIASNANIKKSY